MTKHIFIALGIFLILGLSLSMAFSSKSNNRMNIDPPQYEKLWKEVKQFEKDRLPKSAKKVLDKIYILAKNERNIPQKIKATIYLANLESVLSDKGLPTQIAFLENKVIDGDKIEQAFLYTILAQKYQNYLQRNGWKIRQRTDLAEQKSEDIETWTERDFYDKISSYYLKSVENKDINGQKIKDYADIIEQSDSEIRTNLLDLLGHRALNFFSNTRNTISKPVYEFYVDKKEYFLPADQFVSLEIVSKDQNSDHLKVLQLFQKLMTQKRKEGNEKGVVVLNLQRLNYVYNNGTMTDKDEIYYESLEELLKSTSVEKDRVADALIGLIISKAPVNFTKDDHEDKWTLIHAVKIAKQIIKDSKGNVPFCKNRLIGIERAGFSVTTERSNPMNTPILTQINYKNCTEIIAEIYKIKSSTKLLPRYYQGNEIEKFIAEQAFVSTQTIQLPKQSDYLNHTAEIVLPSLESGRYYVIFSTKKDAEIEKKFVSFQVSNLAFFSQDKKGQNDLYVVDKMTGLPIENAKVSIFTKEQIKNDYYWYKEVFIKDFYTDKDGKVEIGHGLFHKWRNQFFVKIEKNGDTFYNGDRGMYVNGSRTYQSEGYSQTHFFLDRKIYRPGQTIYFKGLLINYNKDRMPTIAPNKAITVTFKNTNYQEVAKLNLVSNEFGSVSGNFTAPNDGLNGQMSLVTNFGNSSTYFSVEEYKRPKFEVEFDKITQIYKPGDAIEMTGFAKAYAGSNIDGAKVHYRVQREVRYPYWPWYRWWSPPYSPPVEIANGYVETDDKGKFVIPFEAVVDKTVNRKNNPEFAYAITVDVTDINGETRSANGSISVCDLGMKASLDIKTALDVKAFESLKINTVNINNQPIDAKGTMVITALVSPNKSYRSRPFQTPNIQLIKKVDFEKWYPNTPFENENKVSNWKKGKVVFNTSFDTKVTRNVDLSKVKVSAGKYLIHLETKDVFGNKIETEKVVTISNKKSKLVATNESFEIKFNQEKYEPTDVVKLRLNGRTAINAFITISKKGKKTQSYWVKNTKYKLIEIPVLESDRGDFYISVTGFKLGEFINVRKRISVPWSNKELKIEYLTFRDKMEPGSKEKWQIKISGMKKDWVATEFLGAMYDKSLDIFRSNSFSLNPFPLNNDGGFGFSVAQLGTVSNINLQSMSSHYWDTPNLIYPNLRFMDSFGYSRRFAKNREMKREVMMDGVAPVAMESEEMALSEVVGAYKKPSLNEMDLSQGSTAAVADKVRSKKEEKPSFSPRTNLKETVFFFPDLKTDKDGNIILEFTMNEALTKWKFLGLAHTKDLQIGITEKEVVTQKEIMVMPNPPRFLREGDKIEFAAKVSNMSDEIMSGVATLELFDPITMESVDNILNNTASEIPFTINAGTSAPLLWNLEIPYGKLNGLTHRIMVTAGNYGDGEESTLPVVTNRTLVTESMPLPVDGESETVFEFSRMKNYNTKTFENHKYTLEFTSNPAWYAVQSLPYLMEYPYECSEQLFSRFYANSLSTHITNLHPNIKKVFESWKNTDALQSNLQKNEELKSALLKETPWVLQAQSEEQQKKNIALLFDLNKMSHELKRAANKLKRRQRNDGGFSWFDGARYSNWYISQYILQGIGHLKQLNVDVSELESILPKLVQYVDNQVILEYMELEKRVKEGHAKWEDDHLSQIVTHYLYTRSFFKEFNITKKNQKVIDYYLGQSKTYWTHKSNYMQGLIALSSNRFDQLETPKKIIASLKERAMHHKELGMYWKANSGYYWYESPIETHTLLMEVFDELDKDPEITKDLKVYLLKNKQTNHWSTTKSTATAIYVLLNTGDNWLLESKDVKIDLGHEKMNQKIEKAQQNAEAGTGYFKTSFLDFTNENATIKVTNPNKNIAWGSVYWQYFEDFDKITHFKDTPLKLTKTLYKIVDSDTGEKLVPVKESALNPGDKIKVRIELQVDRSMDYVHMKDLRASGFEPINVMSQYKWNHGLGYYESTGDISTDFFFSHLPKGTHVFEYPIRVAHRGDFSNGYTSIQCMYAPEFTSHSEGVRVEVE